MAQGALEKLSLEMTPEQLQDDHTSSSRLFQTAGAAVAKAWSPIVERVLRSSSSYRRVLITISNGLFVMQIVYMRLFF